jgi:hypothetical protein
MTDTNTAPDPGAGAPPAGLEQVGRSRPSSAAHIHEAPAGNNGPVIISLDKEGDEQETTASSHRGDRSP